MLAYHPLVEVDGLPHALTLGEVGLVEHVAGHLHLAHHGRLHRILTDAIIVGTILTVRGLDGVGRLHCGILGGILAGLGDDPPSPCRGNRLSSHPVEHHLGHILPQLLRGVARPSWKTVVVRMRISSSLYWASF